MAGSRSRRRPGRLAAANVARARQRRPPQPSPPPPGGRERERRHRRGVLVGLAALGGLAALVAIGVWLHQPPRPDVNALHDAIQARRTGAEVTFTGTLVSEPTNDGGHERMLVRDQLGDTLELDYNVSLGRVVPVHAGDAVVVHGQLYVDPGQVGVHCLHAQTSSGCPEPGWIQFGGVTYS